MLVIAATGFELDPVAASVSGLRSLDREDTWPHLRAGHIAGTPVVLAVAGIGKANMAAAVATAGQMSRPGAVLLVGIGGAYPGTAGRDALALGSVATAASEYDLDLGVGAGAQWRGLETVGFPSVATEPPTYNLVPCHAAASRAAADAVGCPLLPFATSDSITADAAAAARIASATGAAIESMEGVAAAQVCLRLGLPFVELRAVSNAVGVRDKSEWRVAEAIEAASVGALLAVRALAAV